jgi:hypothetical protein
MKTSLLLGCVLSTAISAGCTDFSQPWELDHARVLAVRAAPPGISAGQTSELSALVLRPDLSIAEISAVSITIDEPYDRLLMPATSAKVAAAEEEVVTQARALLELDPAESIQVPVNVKISLMDPAAENQELVSVKTVRVGGSTENPAIPTIAVNGSAVATGVQTPINFVKLQEYTLEANAGSSTEVTYAWFTSRGELKLSEAQLSKLKVDTVGSGTVLVIARDKLGGVAWRQFAFAVTD